jgi:hypothetical protein
MILKTAYLTLLAAVSVTVSTAAYLTNAEIKLKATELLNSPHQILELYAEHKQTKGSASPSALEYLLSSLHVDSMTQPTNHSIRHVLQILSDDQVFPRPLPVLITERAGGISDTTTPPSSLLPLTSSLAKESHSLISIHT